MCLQGSTCKELGNHHSILIIIKKMNKLKKKVTLLESVRQWRMPGKPLSARLERQTHQDSTTAYQSKVISRIILPWELMSAQGNLNCN